jgi:hypothetical protein
MNLLRRAKGMAISNAQFAHVYEGQIWDVLQRFENARQLRLGGDNVDVQDWFCSELWD